MKRLKIMFIIMIISSIALFLCACIEKSETTTDDKKHGITVSGEGEYTWKASSTYATTLRIETDGLTISGAAECDMAIWFMSGVNEICIENLNQSNYKIDLWLPLDEDCELYFSGENTIYCIGKCDNIDIYGNSDDCVLNVTGNIDSHEDLRFSGGIVNTAFLEAEGEIEITGNTKISIIPMAHEQEMETSFARISTDEKLNIDLTDTGMVNIKSNGRPLILADEGIELGSLTVIECDENYSVKFNSVEESYMICDNLGEEPESVIFKSIE